MALVASLSGAARNDGSQKLHFIRRRVQFSDTVFQAGAKIGRIPARSFIHTVAWYKPTAFNSGTSDTASIGSTAGGTDILAATTIATTGFFNSATAAGMGMAVTSETDVFLKWINAGTAATTGDMTVIIAFVPDNDG